MSTGDRMVKRYSIEEARANLDGVVQEAEEGTQVELARRGDSVAVLVGMEDFERLGSVWRMRNSGRG